MGMADQGSKRRLFPMARPPKDGFEPAGGAWQKKIPRFVSGAHLEMDKRGV
jgi:hypothetical protein